MRKFFRIFLDSPKKSIKLLAERVKVAPHFFDKHGTKILVFIFFISPLFFLESFFDYAASFFLCNELVDIFLNDFIGKARYLYVIVGLLVVVFVIIGSRACIALKRIYHSRRYKASFDGTDVLLVVLFVYTCFLFGLFLSNDYFSEGWVLACIVLPTCGYAIFRIVGLSSVKKFTGSYYLPDSGVIKSRDDKLERLTFVRYLKKEVDRELTTLKNSKYNVKSPAIALQGAWGSGKSSALSFLKEKLEKDDAYIVSEFVPWQHEKIHFQALLSHLYDEVSKEFFVPKLGGFFEDLVIDFEMQAPFQVPSPPKMKLKKQINFKKTNEKIIEQINSELSDLPKKIVVIIDEVDRLEGDEIMQLFRMLTSLRGLKNVCFVVSFDKSELLNEILERKKNFNERYLEKIFISQIHMPPVRDEYILKEVDQLIKDVELRNAKGLKEERFEDILIEQICPSLNDLRKVKRFQRALHYHEALKNSSDKLDSVNWTLLSFLRFYNEKLYLCLHGMKREIFAHQNSGKYITKDHLTKRMGGGELDEVSAMVLQHLFPHSMSILDSGLSEFASGQFINNAGTVEASDYAINSSPEIFETYFAVNYSDDDISARSLKSLLEDEDRDRVKLERILYYAFSTDLQKDEYQQVADEFYNLLIEYDEEGGKDIDRFYPREIFRKIYRFNKKQIITLSEKLRTPLFLNSLIGLIDDEVKEELSKNDIDKVYENLLKKENFYPIVQKLIKHFPQEKDQIVKSLDEKISNGFSDEEYRNLTEPYWYFTDTHAQISAESFIQDFDKLSVKSKSIIVSVASEFKLEALKGYYDNIHVEVSKGFSKDLAIRWMEGVIIELINVLIQITETKK